MARDQDRLCDLMRQGFMKTGKRLQSKKLSAPEESIACIGCLNWHRKGRHLLDTATRKRNIDDWNRRRSGATK